VAGEYADQAGVAFKDRDFAMDGWSQVNNAAVANQAAATATNPFRLMAKNVKVSNASYGGLIVNTALKGIEFGPGGVPNTFQYGTNVTATTMNGGFGPQPR